VTVSATYADALLEISVSDTGCGIPSNMLTRILDPFVQVQDPSHAPDRAGGTGLGLSICHRLVEVMGGKLLVESELGKGSVFKVRIPRVSTATEKAPAPAGPNSPAVSNLLPKHVLVVDDSPVNRKVLTAFLKKAGVVSIDQANDGREAFTKLDAAVKSGDPFDFVLSDLWMPDMNGLELIKKLRADGRFIRLPVFAVTADTEFQSDVRTSLFTGVFLKPVTYDKLVRLFASVKHG